MDENVIARKMLMTHLQCTRNPVQDGSKRLMKRPVGMN